MDKLIVIGNGFDLAHGLKTSYNDFLLWYFNNALSTLDVVGTYKDEILEIQAPGYIKLQNSIPFPSINNLFKETTYQSFKFIFHSDFFKSLINDLSIKNWVDIEYAYYRFLLQTIGNVDNINENDLDPVIKKVFLLNNNLIFIEKKLTEYLKTIDVSFGIKLGNISNIFKDAIYQVNLNKRPFSQWDSVLILNFNYTNTLELYAHEFNQDVKIINIHGSIDKESNPVIFGYGDEMDKQYQSLENLNVNSILNHFKSFHYFKTNNYKELNSFLDSDKLFEVAIMGHSCGISDRVLLNRIFEHSHCMSIKIYYHKRIDGSSDFFEKTQEISRHFKPENKAEMRSRIVYFGDCQPLNL